MLVGVWIVVGVWGLILLASAAVVLPRLPAPVIEVPPYQLWWRGAGDPPALDPPPERVHRGETPPPDGPEQVLVLGTATVDLTLPQRLAACGAGCVSVYPLPVGGPAGQARERWLRDLAQAQKVRDVTSPVAAADGRCVWLQRADFALPAVGHDPALRVVRARKAHGLAVDLRDPRDAAGQAIVRASAIQGATLRAGLADALQGDGATRWFMVSLPLLLVVTPLVGLLFEATRWPALLALGVGAAARGMTAVRDGFGYALPLLGPLVELGVAADLARAPMPWPVASFPTVPAAAPQALTGAAERKKGAWLDAAGVPFLARRLGGATAVMEQIYANHPVGRSRLGWFVDRWVQAAPAARAVRHRFYMTVAAGRALAPQRLLSVPCGGGRDAAAIGAREAVLVDPDAHARAVAAAHNPNAQVIDATLETLPDGRFDLILFVGLAEYLDDAVLTRGLVALRERLADGGALICTTTAANADQGRMGALLGWETKARAPADLRRVLDAAGFYIEREQSDPLGIQWLMVARPVATPVG